MVVVKIVDNILYQLLSIASDINHNTRIIYIMIYHYYYTNLLLFKLYLHATLVKESYRLVL